MPLVAAAAALAQESRANLLGRVTDAQGAAIPKASVTVTSDEAGVRFHAVSNEQGLWTVRFLNPGPYTISVQAAGFKVSERKGITLQVADSKQIDISLEVGDISESIEVVGEAPLVDTDAATGGTVIEPTAVTEMPVMSRIPYQLALLSPGVMQLDQNQNVALMWSINATSQIRVNGGRDNRTNEFLLDGMPNTGGGSGTVAYIPPADAVSEFRVMSNAYDAQYGRQAGATINTTIKSGTNQFHANIYEFHRNHALNANQFQSNRAGQPRTPSHYNLYGATGGGPVYLPKLYDGRNRTFFFTAWEGIRNKDPHYSLRSVPTEQERAGDFTGSWFTQTIGSQQNRIPYTIFDPLTVDTRPVPNPTFGYRQPFPGNRIPANRLSPIAVNILKYVPLPNGPSLPTSNAASNFVPDTTRQAKMASVVTRLDQVWSANHKSFASLRWNEVNTYDNYDYDNEATGDYRQQVAKGIGVDHVWLLASSKVLNLRYNVTRFEAVHTTPGSDFDPRKLGFPDAFVGKMEKLSFPRITGLFGNIGQGWGDFTVTTHHNWNANLTHVRGKMTFHYGGEFRVIQEATASYGNQSGQFDFDNAWTRRRYDAGETGYGATMASFLLGLPSSGSFPRNANRFDSQRYLAVFFKDDWRATPRLTLNFGLRWDFQSPFVERFNRLTSVFDPTVLNPISDAAQASYSRVLDAVLKDRVRYPFGPQLAQLVPVSAFKIYGAQLFNGVGGQRRGVTANSYREWQPRVGFAWRATPKTVLRGGFGRFTAGTAVKGGQNGYSRSTTLITTRDSRLTAYDTLEQPFRDGILEPTGSSLGALTNLGQGVNWVHQAGRQPYSWQYSFFVQREYRGWLFETGYSASLAFDIATTLQQNDVTFEQWKMLREPRFDAAGKPLARPYLGDEQVPNPFLNLPGVTGSRATSQWITVYDLMRPLKVLGGQGRSDNPWGKTRYDSLQSKVQRRFSKGFSMLATWTFSKLIEDTLFWGVEVSGPVPEHTLGNEDRTHKLTIAPVWELPIGRQRAWGRSLPKVVDAVVGGWELSGQYIIQSGKPVVFSTNSFFDGQAFGLARNERTLAKWFETSHFVKFPNSQDNIAQYPAWTGVQNLPGASFKPSTSADPRNGVYADFGNYVRRYPTRWANVRESRVNELNFGLFKNFRIRERMKAQFRGEFFNAFNHPRFPGPTTDPGSSTFGRVGEYQQNLARVAQVALKISF